MSHDEDKRIEEDLATVFQAVQRAPLRPDPHLTTKVMARRRERKRSVQPFWKWLAIGAPTALTALGVLFTLFVARVPHYEAFVNRPFVVKMEVADLKSAAIARAEIRLPDGVYFDIEQYPQLRDKRSLALVWRNRDQKEFVPFVLTATEEGTKTISVLFYDENNHLVGEKKLDVRLTTRKS